MTLRLGRLVPRAGTFIQKGVDTLLASDMITQAFKGNYDVAVLVSGDGDFEPVVEAVKEAGKNVVVAAFNVSRSRALFKSADDWIDLRPDFFRDCY